MGAKKLARKSLLKVVYFDEESASDYLDISAGGKETSTSESVKDRTAKMHSEVETRLVAKFSWLPFLGASAEAGGGVDISAAGQSILKKTLSNTILTDYLVQVVEDRRIERFVDLSVSAAEGSMAYMKMFTPYMVVAKTNDEGIDLARMDEALSGAKGYYELIGQSSTGQQPKVILRFNIKAFRNNYGLTDLGRMRLVYHGVLVGEGSESGLGIEAEMSHSGNISVPIPTATDLVDSSSRTDNESSLKVYDVILAGVEHVE